MKRAAWIILVTAALCCLSQPAQASTDSLAAHNPALRADIAYAVNYWGVNPVGTTCGSMKWEVTAWPWAPNVIGETRRFPKFVPYVDFCETLIKYGLGRCMRRLDVIHELGHDLGVRFDDHPVGEPEHSLDPTSVMFPALKVVWAEHPELCPWSTPPPLPPYLNEWIEWQEAASRPSESQVGTG